METIFEKTYLNALGFKLGMVLLIIGGINWALTGIFDLNLVEGIFGNGFMAKIIYGLVGLAAVLIMFNRDTYLPFLGPMVAPCSVLSESTPSGSTREVKVIVSPNSKVLYWAAEPENEKYEKLNNWKQAYLNYDNAGVTISDAEGVAILKVRDPQSYRVPFKGRIDPHVHYRVCGEAGWMGRIQTVKVLTQDVEGFLPKVSRGNVDNKSKLDISDYSASIY
jgi:uncharacterized membrane protein YuzA (DUF378 family)